MGLFFIYNVFISYFFKRKKGTIYMGEKKKLSVGKKILIGIGGFFGGVIALAVTVVLLVNVGKFVVYPEYYSVREVVCTNHGMHDNYVSQGTAITNDGKYLLTSGYMSDKTHSRIYITEIETDKTHYVKLNKPDGNPCTWHCGGISVENGTIYISTSHRVFSIDFNEALNSDELTLKTEFEVNNNSSYMFTDENYMYVGEFYRKKSNETENKITYNDKTYNAIVEQYSLSDFSKPVAVFAVRNLVQGFARNEDGDILLSTSYGLDSSNFYWYTTENIISTGETYLDAPLYVLENHDNQITAPAMSEDLDYLNGKFYTNYESACNKYVYGKFILTADKIVALKIK